MRTVSVIAGTGFVVLLVAGMTAERLSLRFLLSEAIV
jgi:hypothetical protein